MHKFSTAVPQSSSVLHRLRCASLGSSAYCTSTPAGPLGYPQAGRTPCHRGASAALRYENLCIIPARPAFLLLQKCLHIDSNQDILTHDYATFFQFPVPAYSEVVSIDRGLGYETGARIRSLVLSIHPEGSVPLP